MLYSCADMVMTGMLEVLLCVLVIYEDDGFVANILIYVERVLLLYDSCILVRLYEKVV